MRMRTFFVFPASVVMHLMGMTFSFVRVHILPRLVGTSCARHLLSRRFLWVVCCVLSVSLHRLDQVAAWLILAMHHRRLHP